MVSFSIVRGFTQRIIHLLHTQTRGGGVTVMHTTAHAGRVYHWCRNADENISTTFVKFTVIFLLKRKQILFIDIPEASFTFLWRIRVCVFPTPSPGPVHCSIKIIVFFRYILPGVNNLRKHESLPMAFILKSSKIKCSDRSIGNLLHFIGRCNKEGSTGGKWRMAGLEQTKSITKRKK